MLINHDKSKHSLSVSTITAWTWFYWFLLFSFHVWEFLVCVIYIIVQLHNMYPCPPLNISSIQSQWYLATLRDDGFLCHAIYIYLRRSPTIVVIDLNCQSMSHLLSIYLYHITGSSARKFQGVIISLSAHQFITRVLILNVESVVYHNAMYKWVNYWGISNQDSP